MPIKPIWSNSSNNHNQTKQVDTDLATLAITPDVLAEMELIAINCPLEFAEQLPYPRLQQTLTLWSLLKYFEERMLTPPFHLELLKDGPKEKNKPRRD